jgi:hypothetical protein
MERWLSITCKILVHAHLVEKRPILQFFVHNLWKQDL